MRISGTFRECLNLFRGKRRGGENRPTLRAFIAHKGGAVALLFGLALIPMIGFIGGAIDYANAYRMRSKLQDALDTATLAAGHEVDMGASVSDAKSTAAKVLKANLGDDAPSYDSTLNIDTNAGTVAATAEMRVNTYLLGVVGRRYFDVKVDSTVKLPRGKVEVALVLDNSGSMAGSKIRDLQDAAKRLTQILFQNSHGDDWVKIGVVPFAASVNVGPRYANASWMDTGGNSSIHFENLDNPVTRFTLYNQMRGTSWAGCVEVRPSPYDVTDAAPTPSDGDTYFVPMFAPDEPDRRRYNNSYLDDDGGSCSGGSGGESDTQAQEKTCKYDNERPSSRKPGPNYMCTTQSIQELTNNESRLTTAIDAMRANGLTNIHEGVMWGWRILSPDEPFTEGRPYDAEDNNKVMIVMTDGKNTHQGRSNDNKSNYSAYGYAKNGRLRSPTSSTSRLVRAMNGKTLQSCTNAKASGVMIYTIAVGVNDSDTLNMLASCATSRSRAFTIDDGDALTAVFEAIAGEINKLRIAG